MQSKGEVYATYLKPKISTWRKVLPSVFIGEMSHPWFHYSQEHIRTIGPCLAIIIVLDFNVSGLPREVQGVKNGQGKALGKEIHMDSCLTTKAVSQMAL